MTIEQRYEILCQIIRDYGLSQHMDRNREQFERQLGLNACQVGHDIALIDMLVHGEGLYPINYVLAERRAIDRLGLVQP